jgi:hypothetical protein
MVMGATLILLVILGPGTALLAQARPGAGEILVEPRAPLPDGDVPDEVRLPPPGPEREVFLSRFLWVDPHANEVSALDRRLAPREFYLQVGRPDLAAWSEDRTRQRIWLMAGGSITLLAGVVSGAVIMAGAQDSSAPSCGPQYSPTYADCVDRSQRATTTGALLVGAGVGVGGALLALGISTSEMVTTHEETVRLAADYNHGLAAEKRAERPHFRLLPALGPGYAGLSARLTF